MATNEMSVDPISVTVTTEFMEDYHAGRPWSHSQALDEVYVSRDGTAQLLPVTQFPPAVARVAPDSDSITGWSPTLTIGTDSLTAKAKVVHRSRFNFLREAQIWYNRAADERVLSANFENVIVLSDEFFQEIMAHPIPTDLEAVKLPASRACNSRSFRVGLSYRCFTAKGKESIPIFGDFGLVRQIGTVEYARPRRFREKLNQWIRTIRLVWPECPAKISSDGLHLVVDHAPTAVHPAVCLKSN
jgi:hypothetical protein